LQTVLAEMGRSAEVAPQHAEESKARVGLRK
jgi:hypothetical protein